MRCVLPPPAASSRAITGPSAGSLGRSGQAVPAMRMSTCSIRAKYSGVRGPPSGWWTMPSPRR